MDYKAEKIKPYDDETDKTTQVREMFDSIAPAYDAMNRTMTVGIDCWWRRVAVKMLRRYPHCAILDVATGTGDLALLLDERLHPDQIIGIDLSEGMLRIAREKAVKRNAQRRFPQSGRSAHPCRAYGCRHEFSSRFCFLNSFFPFPGWKLPPVIVV